MAEKDIAEKTLESFNDVFADIVNVLLFNGKRLVQEEDLTQASPRSSYKMDGKLREQERDVSKYWKKANIRVALLAGENQTEVDPVMPVRVIGYDGASYRAQLKNDRTDPLYPVVTLVLYFGISHWDKHRTLLECLNVPPELKPFVSNYNINVFEIAWLSDEQVEMFQSDFHAVADFFVQKRKNNNYNPDKRTIRHVEEVLQLLAILTKDHRYEDVISDFAKGAETTMCAVIDKYIETGLEKGRVEGRVEGRAEGELRWQTRFGKLTEILSAKNLISDIVQSATDPEYAKKLMAQYGI